MTTTKSFGEKKPGAAGHFNLRAKSHCLRSRCVVIQCLAATCVSEGATVAAALCAWPAAAALGCGDFLFDCVSRGGGGL